MPGNSGSVSECPGWSPHGPRRSAVGHSDSRCGMRVRFEDRVTTGYPGSQEELDEGYEGRTVTIEEPATGKSYAGTMKEVWESDHNILFVETEDDNYVTYGEFASVWCFSDSAWEEFCEGHNPRT